MKPLLEERYQYIELLGVDLFTDNTYHKNTETRRSLKITKSNWTLDYAYFWTDMVNEEKFSETVAFREASMYLFY